MQNVGIFSFGVGIVGRQIPQHVAVALFLAFNQIFKKQLWGNEPIHTCGNGHFHFQRFTWKKIGSIDIQQITIREDSRGFEDIQIQSGGEVQTANIVQGELAQIDLAGLAVGKDHAIVGHARVLRAKPAHGNRFHSSGATIVLDHHSRHVFQSIRQLQRRQIFNLMHS